MATTVRLELYVRSSKYGYNGTVRIICPELTNVATTVQSRLLGQDSRNDSMVSIFTLGRGNRINNQLMMFMPFFSVTSTFARTCSCGLVHLELQLL